ncbi:MAG: hypothetical protein U1A78_33395 [Polyangia bacterium]
MNTFPVAIDDFLYNTSRLLSLAGARAEVSLIASCSNPQVQLADYDNWDGGQHSWSFDFSLPIQTYSSISDSDRETMQNRIQSTMRDIIKNIEGHHISEVRINMEISKADNDWRMRAAKWANGEGLTNQGRVRSTNIAPFECDGLLFRSRAEINLYRAFKTLSVAIAPLPVFVRGGQGYQRIEPDFILIHANTMMVVEVDGENFHPETPVDAHERLSLLSREGVHTERIRAVACDTPEKARASAEKLLGILQRRAAMR